MSHACSTNKGRRVLHKRQNLIQDDESLAQNLTKKTAVHQQNKVGSKDINYLSFFLNKQRTDFFRNSQESQRKQIWTRENSCASPLLQYVTFAMLYFALFGVAKITPLQIVLIGSLYYFIPLYHLYTNYTLRFHIVPLLLILIISSL